jgi:hypothetical protein
VTPLLLGFLSFLVLIVNFVLELLESKLNDLLYLLLGVEGVDESALLCHFKELYKEMLFVHASVAHTKLHEQVFKLNLCWIFKRCYPHCVHPESQSFI